MENVEQEVWSFLDRHLRSIFTHDSVVYRETTSEELSLYEWYITPHRLDGLDFHFFMIENNWAGAGKDFRYDLLERRLQLYGDTAIASYTFVLSLVRDGKIVRQAHNESRVLVRIGERWKVVHVHKSPAWHAPHLAPAGQ